MDLVALFELAAPVLARATLLTLGFAVAARYGISRLSFSATSMRLLARSCRYSGAPG